MSPWVPALVASAISAVVAIAVSFQNARSQRQLKWLDTKLAEQSAESAAKRSYEYEARKRLYSEVNPQLFQLREACDTSARRLRRIINGDININGDIKIVPPKDIKHLITSTERLFAPLVFAQELRRHLTEVDLRLDDSIRAQYMISRELLWTFHEGMDIAKVSPCIPYRVPGHKGRKQHLTVAEVQRLVDFLTVPEANGSGRPMKRYELDDNIDDERLKATIQPVSHLLDGANPTVAPVLWRLLLAQASLMHVFIQFADSSTSYINGDPMPPDIQIYKNECESPEHFNEQVDAARQYVEQRLRLLLA